ncbi:MAG TPA: ABC transporter permease [Spirochaetota bacterium]|nr:ABC transporter permease [Spirochaetota bacterium]HOD16800.1 ABC transporter permease [Spirochaetota bacterium]HPG50560.1 ABC transporter permease [Spirochaetota bacterium]HPN11422.1 ABC transporter permease [Spirochaetota bacterium]
MSLYELLIGFRYLKSKKSQGIVSSNTLLSIIIVFLGVFILIVVLSVMNGFQAAIKDKILDVDSHITVQPPYGSEGQGIRNYDQLVKKIKRSESVRAADPYILSQGLFRFESSILPVMIRAIGVNGTIPRDVEKFIVKDEEQIIKSGKHRVSPKIAQKFFATRSVFIGQEMADSYNILIGDYIELIVPKGTLSVRTGITPGMEQFRVIGMFKTGYYDFDTKLIIMSLPQGQRLFEIGDAVSAIGIRIRDVFKMDSVSDEMDALLGYGYNTMTAEEKNGNLFYALKLEKLIMMIILFLVIISAGFTIMGTLVMVVMEKRKAVGILKSMGARPNSIMVIFVLEGFFIGIIGAFLGVVFGIAAALNLDAIIRWVENVINSIAGGIYALFNMGLYEKINLVPSHVYYIEGIPTEVNPELVVFIAIIAVFLCTVAAILPAWSASRLQPVETIRYE